MEFSDLLMTGEVNAIETTFNICVVMISRCVSHAPPGNGHYYHLHPLPISKGLYGWDASCDKCRSILCWRYTPVVLPTILLILGGN